MPFWMCAAWASGLGSMGSSYTYLRVTKQFCKATEQLTITFSVVPNDWPMIELLLHCNSS